MTAKFNVESAKSLHATAHEAGMKAGQNVTCQPMTVVGAGYREVVDDGVCGFAWVSIKGNTSFGRAMKKAGITTNDYPTGQMIWVSAFGQSMQRKEAYARAYAGVLNANGVTAYPRSRMD